jgi:predicted PurR-regulated permease PerM
VAIWVIAILFVFQFVIVNVLMPRMMSEAVGLHPLLVFAAILFSVKVAGCWGAFFGIPVAGVMWAMGKFFFEEWRRTGPPGRAVTDDDMD